MACCLSHRTVSDIYWLQQRNLKNTVSYCLTLKNHLHSHTEPLKNERKTSLSERKTKSKLLQDHKNNHLSIKLPMGEKKKTQGSWEQGRACPPPFRPHFTLPSPQSAIQLQTPEHGNTKLKMSLSVWQEQGTLSGVCPLLPTCQSR